MKLSQILSTLRLKKQSTPEGEKPERPRSTTLDVLLVGSTSMLMIITVLSQFSINLALPAIGDQFSIPASRLEWPLASMSLATGCLILPFGRLSDIFGARKMFLGGMVTFIISNGAAALCQTEIQLNIFRAFQGAGGAASIPAAVAILAHTFPETSPYRAIAFACFSAGSPIGSAFGSVFGGILTQYASWRVLFWFTAGLTLVPLVLGYFVIPRDKLEADRDTRVDYLGTFLVIAGLVLLTFALTQGPSAGWRTPYIIAFFILSGFLLLAFAGWEHILVHSPRFSLPPLLPLEIFRRGRVLLVMIVGFTTWAAFQPLLLYIVLYYQQYLDLTPMQTMIRLLPTAVSGVLCNFAFAILVPHVYGWTLLAFGCLGTAFACALFASIVPSVTFWAMSFPSTFSVVVGADFVYATASIYLAFIAGPSEQALLGGLFQTFTQLGVAVGLAFSQIARDAAQSHAAPGSSDDDSNIPKEALLKGFQAAQWAAFCFAAIGLLISIIFLQPIKVLGHRRIRKRASSMDSSTTVVDVEGAGAKGDATGGPAEKSVEAHGDSLPLGAEEDLEVVELELEPSSPESREEGVWTDEKGDESAATRAR